MPLELHIFGPAYSLPSIDPSCLAAVAYMTQTVPRGTWVVVGSCELGLRSGKELPLLRDGPTTVAGFGPITTYLRTLNPRYDLDTHLSPLQQADLTAFTSHALRALPPLYLLSHYLSSENYTKRTLPALSPLLPPSQRYTLPSHLRSNAAQATSHLGFTSADLTLSDPNPPPRTEEPTADAIPLSLRSAIPASLSQALGGAVHRDAFKLEALIDAAFEPLQTFLHEGVPRNRQFFFRPDTMTSLDCLALGFLSLLLIPDVPLNFLAKALRERYSRLCTFVDEGLEKCFLGVEVGLEDAFLGTRAGVSEGEDEEETADEEEFEEYENMRVGAERKVPLPWRRGEGFGVVDTLGVWGKMALGGLGVVGGVIVDDEERRSSNPGPVSKLLGSSTLGPALWTIGAGLAAATSYLLYHGDIAGLQSSGWAGEGREDVRSFGEMGEAGAMLSVLGGASRRSTKVGRHGGVVESVRTGGNSSSPLVEVDVEVERDA